MSDKPDEKNPVDRLLDALDGNMEDMYVLPDGSGFFTMSYPLPEDHWLYAGDEDTILDEYGYEDPPAHMRIGTDDPSREFMVKSVRQAARYAIRVTTDNGKIDDFDPDAMVTNFVIGLLGYYTPDGTNNTSDLDDQSNP